MRALYQAEVVGEDVEDALKNVLDAERVTDRGREYLAYVLARFVDHKSTIDAALEAQSEHWTLRRMAATDRNVLRLGAFELLFAADTPVSVALDEAIELARRFGSADSPAFVNGVLDRLRRSAQPAAGEGPS